MESKVESVREGVDSFISENNLLPIFLGGYSWCSCSRIYSII